MDFENIVFNLSSFINNKTETELFFKEFLKFSTENNLKFYLVSGFKEEKTFKIIEKFNLSFIFNKKNVFSVSKEYLSDLNTVDYNIRIEKYKQNSEYVDEYFKIYFLNKLKANINNNKTLFVGHDIWTDAYYISEYTKSHVLLLKPSLSFNNKKYDKDLKTINTIDLKYDDFKTFILNPQTFNYANLKSFAKNYIMSTMVGKLDLNLDFDKIYKK